MYDRRCRDKHENLDKPFVIRFKTPLSGEIHIPDLIKGDVRVPLAEVDDFVILRSNNVPTYNFTVVVDDVDMRITHVIRAEEHLNNTPKQMLLMQAMELTPPRYAHVPLVLAADKTKLSKRHGVVAVTEFKREGYLPEAMVSTLMRLGWSHGDQEIFTGEELVQHFDLSGCGSSGAVFDKNKLNSVNAHFIKLKTPQQLAALVDELFSAELGGVSLTQKLAEDAKLGKLLEALKQRAHTLKDIVTQASWYLREDFTKEAQLVEEVLKPADPKVFAALKESFAAIGEGDFVAEKTGPVFKEVATKLGLKMPQVAKPARVALTGSLASPDIGLVCEVLGKDRVLSRLSL
jgi:glutamyl-tRNA synthetase